MPPESRKSSPTLRVLQKNVKALVAAREEFERNKGIQARIADRMTAFIGTMPFVYLHAGILVAWLVINVGWVRGIEPFDPHPFVMLAMSASVEAIFLSTFVLISQNRMQRLSDRRNELDLQISLVAEREITAILSIVHALARRLDVPTGQDPEELADLERVITPEEAMAHIDRHDPA